MTPPVGTAERQAAAELVRLAERLAAVDPLDPDWLNLVALNNRAWERLVNICGSELRADAVWRGVMIALRADRGAVA